MSTDTPFLSGKRSVAPSRAPLDKAILVRMSAAEHAALLEKAAAADMSAAALLRAHATGVYIRNRSDEKKRLGLLNRINANLNMIARWVNTYTSSANALQVMVYLSDVRREVSRLLAALDRQR